MSATAVQPELREAGALLLDPVQFSRVTLGHRLWSGQQQIMRAVQHNPLVTVKGCHASGKTFATADLVLWWITHDPEAVAIITAPTNTQGKIGVWQELRKAVGTARMAYPEPLETQMTLGLGNYAMVRTTNAGVRFQGLHGKVLIIVDEAMGVEGDIWGAIEGATAAGDVRVLVLGNPTEAAGWYYGSFSSPLWQAITLSAFDTPNMAGLTLQDLLRMEQECPDELDRNVRPELATRRWVLRMYHEHGEDSPDWQGRVLAQFPQHGISALIPLAALERAKAPAADSGGEVAAGLDVAGPGEDKTVLAIRQGNNVLRLQEWTQEDPRGEVLAALAPWKQRLQTVNVDSIGIGWGMSLHIRDAGYPVQQVNVGEKARDSERFANLKAELYWGLRDRFKEGALGITDTSAFQQLSRLKYKHNPAGKIIIQEKAEYKRENRESPDKAEAIMLSFAAVPRPRRVQSFQGVIGR